MKNYYYMNLGGMFTKVEKTTEKKEILPKYIKEISEEEYNKFINKDFEIANIY